MIKKGIKLIVIILIIFLLVNIIGINNKVYAASIDITENVDYWSNISQADTGQAFDGIIKDIVSIIRTVGMIVSVIALAVIGLKFMLGSVEEKAQYKQTLFPWLIGAIMVFAITTVPILIYDGIKSIFS